MHLFYSKCILFLFPSPENGVSFKPIYINNNSRNKSECFRPLKTGLVSNMEAIIYVVLLLEEFPSPENGVSFKQFVDALNRLPYY